MVHASAVIFNEVGDPQKVLHVGSAELPEPKDDEVLLRTLASPLNPSDVVTVQGLYATIPPRTTEFSKIPSAVVGFEGVFEVIKIGKDVTTIKVGDWALPGGSGLGTWRTHAILPAKVVFPLPKVPGLDPVAAATILANPLTAYQMLTFYEKLEAGDWVIQNGANSAVGRAVIQFANYWGVKTINVVRDRKDFKEVEADLKSIGADVVITDKELQSPDFHKTIPQLTNSQRNPVKLGFDCVGDANGTAILGSIKSEGSFVIYGSLTQKPLRLEGAFMIYKDVKIRGYWLTAQMQKNRAGREAGMKAIFKLFSEGKFQVGPTQKHIWKIGASDEDNLNTAKKAFEVHTQGYSGKKQVLVFEEAGSNKL